MGFLSDAGFLVTQKTIQRDLHELSATHPLVLDERSKPTGWFYMVEHNNRAEPMNPFEALAYIIASRAFSSKLPSGIAQYLLPQELAASACWIYIRLAWRHLTRKWQEFGAVSA
jgi:hypothetical protein